MWWFISGLSPDQCQCRRPPASVRIRPRTMTATDCTLWHGTGTCSIYSSTMSPITILDAKTDIKTKKLINNATTTKLPKCAIITFYNHTSLTSMLVAWASREFSTSSLTTLHTDAMHCALLMHRTTASSNRCIPVSICLDFRLCLVMRPGRNEKERMNYYS